MKQTKIKKIASVLVVIAVLVCALAGISASAVTEGEIQVSAEIKSVNVEHRGCMHLAFKVETTSAPDGAVIGIAIKCLIVFRRVRVKAGHHDARLNCPISTVT